MAKTDVKVQELKIADLKPAKWNRAANDDEIAGLAESIAASGVLQPIRARRVQGRLEIVCGHRRTAAAKRAGFATIPGIVETMTDEAAQVAGLVENLQRRNPTPLVEAFAYRRLAKLGVAEKEIAAQMGKPVAYVARRMRLTELPPKAIAALEAGELSVDVAEQIARLPGEAMRAEATKLIVGTWSAHDPNEASGRIGRLALRVLKGAPFKTDDAELVVKAGPCTTCPKRARNAPSLFGDVTEDVCTDTGCYADKAQAAWAIKREALQARGVAVLEGNQAKDALESRNSKYVRPEETCHQDAQYRRWRELVKGRKVEDTAVVCLDPAEGAQTVWLRSAAVAAAKANGFLKPKPKPKAGSDGKVSMRDMNRLHDATRRIALERAVADIRLCTPVEALRKIGLALFDSLPPDSLRAAIGMTEAEAAAALKPHGTEDGEVAPLVLRIAAFAYGYDETCGLDEGAAVRLGVDWNACAIEARDQIAVQQKAARSAAKSAKPAKGKRGAKAKPEPAAEDHEDLDSSHGGEEE